MYTFPSHPKRDTIVIGSLTILLRFAVIFRIGNRLAVYEAAPSYSTIYYNWICILKSQESGGHGNSPSDFIRDSAFRLKVGEELMTKIEEGGVVIERKV